MNPRSKHTHAALLALLGSHHSAGGIDTDVTVSRHGFRTKLIKNYLGAECVPSILNTETNQDKDSLSPPRHNKTSKTDVGILSSKLESCPGSNELCKVDATSLLGGRCVMSSSRRAEWYDRSEAKLQACKARCPDTKLCDCLYDVNIDCAVSDIPSACRNKDHLKCLASDDMATLHDVFYCPAYSCMEDVKGVGLADEEIYYTCMICVGYATHCDYCNMNGPHTGCDTASEFCKDARINKTYHYSQNCTDFLGSSLDGGFSSGSGQVSGAIGTAAAALALISMANLHH
eukprot:64954_1